MKSNRYVLLMVFFVVLCMSTVALGKTQITIWCLSFDPM